MKFPDEPFLFSDLPALGLTRGDLRAAVADGRVRRLLRNVYVAATTPVTVQLRARAIALVMPPGTVVSDRTAAWLHGVDVLDPGEREADIPLEVVRVNGTRSRRREALGGRRTLEPGDVVEVQGVPVTSPLRTACDLGRSRGRSSAFAAMCMLVRTCGIDRQEIVTRAARLAGQRGVVQLRGLAPLVTGLVESPAEAWTLIAMLDEGLPCPEAQHELTVPGYGPVRLDFAFPWARVAVEYDGEEHHSDENDVMRDQRRRNALRATGWTVIVVRKDDFSGARLLDWLADVRHALEAAGRGKRRYARSTAAERGFAR